MKNVERGYLVIFLELILLTATIIAALLFQKMNMDRAYAVALANVQNNTTGMYYSSGATYSVDMSVFNYICTALSAALGVSVAAQFRKKRVNNTWQYMEECMDRWFKDENMRPYAIQLMQTFLQTNQNN